MDDIIERSTYLKIGVGNFPPPAPDMTLNNGVCSIFKFKIKKGSVAYRYDLEIYYRNPRESDLTKKKRHLTKGFDDGLRNWNRAICAKLLEKLTNMTEFIKTSPAPEKLKYVYDSGKNIFFNQDLKDLDGKVFVVGTNDLDEKQQSYLKNRDVEVVFKKSASYVLKLDDTASALCTSDTMKPDRSLRTFLEMLSNQGLLSNGQNLYESIGIGKVYRTYLSESTATFLSGKRLSGGVILREGFQKGVRIIDPNAPTPAMVIDAKASAFYPTVTLDKLIFNNSEKTYNFFTKMYKGVRACLTHDYSQTILISRFSSTPVKDMKIIIQNGEGDAEITLLEFYKKKGIPIKHPGLPVVIGDGKHGRAYAPELLYILPLQRVSIQAMESDIADALGEVNQLKLKLRHGSIMKSFGEVKSLCASYFNAFGVELLDDNRIQVGYRRKPTMVFDDKKLADRRKIEHWAFYNVHDGIENQKLIDFVRNLIRSAAEFGVTIQPPKEVVSFPSIGDAENHFKTNMMSLKLRFILFCSDKSEDIHNRLKMAEIRYRVITQHIHKSRLKPGGATMQNIIFKLHVKNAGLNYIPKLERSHALDLASKNILVISYDVSHPGKSLDRHELWKVRQIHPECDALEPSVVGYCANTMQNPNAFSGNYFYQEPRREAVDSTMLERKAEEVLNMFVSARRQFPGIVFVIRDGVSEGQFEMAANQECIALKKGCANAMKKIDPNGDIQRTRFAFTIVSKRHNKRFFLQDPKKGIVDTRPVSVIDRGIVRADAHEFFMQPYTNSMGTVKMPQYTTIINEGNFSTKDLQEFFTVLCYSHQIVRGGIALPCSVHLANELAKRGRNNFLTFRKQLPDFSLKYKLSDGTYDFERLNERFTYNNVSIRNQRFTA